MFEHNPLNPLTARDVSNEIVLVALLDSETTLLSQNNSVMDFCGG
jgi:hypothetical protein